VQENPRRSSSHRRPKRLQFELNMGLLLQRGKNFEQIPGVRIPRRPQHPHQALGRMACDFRRFSKLIVALGYKMKD